jgi:tetratricopeptide (TPR) repeat protein
LDGQIRALQDELRADADNGRAARLLGQAYLQKARESGDPSYYPKAEQLFQRALDVDPNDHEALVGLGTLALARHHFAEALTWGERARDLNPYHAPAYGVIGDALVELGRYDEAVQTIQRMVDLRPDLASYARVSYLRELMGDRDGAIAAMEQAAVAGAAHAENVAWTQVQLGNLFFDGGDLAAAEHRYDEALAVLPDYVYAVAGQARVAAARGDLARAADLYAQAVRTTPLPEFVIAYGDVLTAAGRSDEAAAQYALVGAIQQLYAANGVDTDLELALFTADYGDSAELPAALAMVRAQVAVRPSIVADDILAWLFYKSGDLAGAQAASQQALRLGTRSALMHFHAGMIEAAVGNRDAAISHLQTALDLNPHFSVRFAPEARATLDRLLAEESAR